MDFPNIFTKEVTDAVIKRINNLTPETHAQWGKMNVGQMLAHCNVTYEMAYEDIHPKPGFIMKFVLKNFVKKIVVGTGTYGQSLRTAPQFIITTQKDFDKEKNRLIAYLQKTQQLGEDYFEGRMSHSFGVLNKNEWNSMFYKHLNHHLTQFGV